jgi:radical SAM protein with 4Fe4S-binding SPASM domain
MRKTAIQAVQIELTNHCNFHCVRCPRDFDRGKGFMDWDLFVKVADQCFKYAASITLGFFGEPMMYPRLFDAWEYLAKKPKGMRVAINTNLSFATREHFDRLINRSGVSQFRMSIDAATSDLYDVVRPSQSVQDLDGNTVRERRLDAIDEKVRYWFSLPGHVPTRHVYPVSSVNAHEAEDFVAKWKPLLGPNDHILLKKILTYGGKIYDSQLEDHPCNIWDINGLTVDHLGNVSPCNLDTNMDLTCGSIHEQSLSQIFRGKEYKRIRQLSRARQIVPCNTCIDANNWSKNITIMRDKPWNPARFRHMYGIAK